MDNVILIFICYSYSILSNPLRKIFNRDGINRLCKSISHKPFLQNGSKNLIQHITSCAVNMLLNGYSITDIRNRLGHENILVYLHLDLARKREVQKRFMEYTQTVLPNDPQVDELIDWKNKVDILSYYFLNRNLFFKLTIR